MSEIDALLKEDRSFPPAAEWRRSANVADPGVYDRAAADPEAFWAGFASELEWMRPWDSVLEWKSPHAKWFVGGKLNISANCLDRHVADRPAQQGRLHLGRRAGRSADADLLGSLPSGLRVRQRPQVARREARRSRRALPSADPRARDRDARLRAHRRRSTASCSAASAPNRCATASTIRECVLLVTADGGYRRGQIVPLKQMADEALRETPSIRERRRRAAAGGRADSRRRSRKGAITGTTA